MTKCCVVKIVDTQDTEAREVVTERERERERVMIGRSYNQIHVINKTRYDNELKYVRAVV